MDHALTALLSRPFEHEDLRRVAKEFGLWTRLSRLRLQVRGADEVWHGPYSQCGRSGGATKLESRTVASLSGTWCRCLVTNAADFWSGWSEGSSGWFTTLFYAARADEVIQLLSASRKIAHVRELAALTQADVPMLSPHRGLTKEQADLLTTVLEAYKQRAKALLETPAAAAKRRRLALAALVKESRLGPFTLDKEEVLVGCSISLTRLRRGRPALGETLDACQVASEGDRSLFLLPRYAYDVFQRSLGSGVDFRGLQAASPRKSDPAAVVVLWDPASDGPLCDLSRAVEASILL